MFCTQCGADLKSADQKFCESCGAKVASKPENREARVSPEVEISTDISATYQRPIGLFDLSRTYYILKEKYWDWGSGDILDEQGQLIGKMKRKILSIRKRVELKELDGSVAATIHAKLISARGAQDLKDPEGNLIARIKKKILTLMKPKFFLCSSI